MKICNLIIIQDILLLVTILRIVLPHLHPSVHDETGRRLGVWSRRSHGDNSPTLAWDCKTYLCIGSQYDKNEISNISDDFITYLLNERKNI